MSDLRKCRFDRFLVEPGERRISSAGEAVHLEPRSFEVLVHLLERRGHLVRKDELLDRVWSDVHVTEAALAKSVARIRKALGDDAQEPRFIQTVPTLGYRFIAEVAEERAPEDGAGAGRAAPREADLAVPTWGRATGPDRGGRTGTRLVGWARQAGVVLVALLVALTVLWVGSLDDEPGWPAGALNADQGSVRIVVLPFQNLGDGDEAYFVDGVHDELISALTRVPRLRVLSRTTASHYGSNGLSVPQIGDELDVEYVIEGSVLPAGPEVRINAQLIHAASDEHLWAATYDRDLGDVLGVLSEVAAAVAAEVDVSLSPEDRSLIRHQSVDPAAQEAYLRARHALNRWQGDLAEAEELFQRALEIEPDFVGAHSGLAFTYVTQGLFGWGYPMGPRARDAAERVLRMDPRRAEAHMALGWVQMYFEREFEEARASFERALALDPCNPHARHGMADYLALVGRRGEAAEQTRIARQCDPFSNLTAAIFIGHLYIGGRYGEAIAEARACLEEDPDFGTARAFLAQALWQAGQLQESVAEQRRVWAGAPELVAALDEGLARGGPTAARRSAATTLAGLDWERREGGVAISFAYAGDADEAIHWLERAEASRDDPLMVAVMTRPEFDFLRDRPRFRQLWRRMGLPDIQGPPTEVAARD